jgi:hypothetical protein
MAAVIKIVCLDVLGLATNGGAGGKQQTKRTNSG